MMGLSLLLDWIDDDILGLRGVPDSSVADDEEVGKR